MAHGQVTCDAWGYERNPEEYSNLSIKIYYLYFYYGILLFDKDAYDLIIKEAYSLDIRSSDSFYYKDNFLKLNKIISENAIFPFSRKNMGPSSGYTEATGLITSSIGHATDTFFSGAFTPLFTDYELHFDNGDLLGYKKQPTYCSIIEMLKDIPFLDDWDFGGKPEVIPSKNISVKSCEDCMDHNYDEDGEKCRSCTCEWGGDWGKNNLNNDNSDISVTLCHTIATQLAPIIGDLESLIGEVETSEYKDMVSDKFIILTDANNKLKEITI
jgi:hypothetical protein